MLEFKLILSEDPPVGLLNCPIKDMSFNPYTGVLAAASSDSRVVLMNTESENQRSIVNIDVGLINRMVWTGHYDLVAAGSDGCLHHYSMMGMVGESFSIHNSSIATMRKRGNFIFTGAADGNVAVWDFRRHEVVANIEHRIRNRVQPIKSIDAYGNYLYTSTIYQGKVWIWDLRNTSKKLGDTGTGDCQNTIEYIKGNLYSTNGTGVLRISASLSNYEFLYRKPSTQACTWNSLVYNERYRSIIWADKETVYISRIDDEVEGREGFLSTNKWDMKGIGGIEKFKSDKVFIFKNNGTMSTMNIAYDLGQRDIE